MTETIQANIFMMANTLIPVFQRVTAKTISSDVDSDQRISYL